MQMKLSVAALTVMLGTAAIPAVLAGPGHDHADEPASKAGAALPRFAVTSETFELVGVLNGKQLTLYLDRTADNSPVKDARLELDLGGAKVDVKPHAEGEFEAVLAQAPQPGVIPVTATVHAGGETDLLAGELDLHAAAHGESAHVHGWKKYAAWIGAGVGALVLSLLGARRLTLRRRARAGGPA